MSLTGKMYIHIREVKLTVHRGHNEQTESSDSSDDLFSRWESLIARFIQRSANSRECLYLSTIHVPLIHACVNILWYSERAVLGRMTYKQELFCQIKRISVTLRIILGFLEAWTKFVYRKLYFVEALLQKQETIRLSYDWPSIDRISSIWRKGKIGN